MNEVVSVFTIDILFNLDPSVHADKLPMDVLGFAFIFMIFVNLIIHMWFIIRGGCRDFRRQRKNKAYLKRYTIWYEALGAEDKEKRDSPEDIKEKMS